MHDKPLTDDSLQRIRNLVTEQTGLSLREQDEKLLRDIVRERVRVLKLSGAEEYYRLLVSRDGPEQAQLMVLLTTGETYFFRDSGQFALLRQTILPELIERRSSTRSLRLWSAACSSGEEAYSLAMLLDEVLADQSGWDIQILGSDVNEQAIEKARRATYTEWSFRATDDVRRQRYFRCDGSKSWVLDRRIRERVTFRNINMLTELFPDSQSDLSEMDLILCRNLFIYLQPEMITRVTDKLTGTLAEGGYLLTGHGELYAHHLGNLRTRIFPESLIYQKVTKPVLQPFVVAEPVKTQPADWWICALEPWSPDSSKGKPASVSAPAVAAKIAGETTEPQSRPEPDAMQQAWQLANRGERDKAAARCEEMIAAQPFAAEPYYLLALLAQERGNAEEAKTLLKKTIYLLPSFVAAYLELGDIYQREHNNTLAGKMRSTALDLLQTFPPDEPVRFYGSSTVREIIEYLQQQATQTSQAS